MRKTMAVLAALTALGPSTQAEAGALKGDCPDGYVVKAGLNTDFPHNGEKRAFLVYPPEGSMGPAPVFVPLTGSVESTLDNLTAARSGATSLMAKLGFLIVGPVRQCANQDPNLKAGVCNGPGHDGWNWNPWREGRAPGLVGDRFKTDEGPDSSFLIAAIKCAAKSFPVDAKRVYLGGISSGGTMTNRALTFRSDFWAGGLPISGEWYVTEDKGTPLSFEGGRSAIAASPAAIHQGRVGPFPLKSKLDPMIVISVWGGQNDLWKCDGVLCADYRPSTQAASNYFASMKNVVHVACTASHGHMWPQMNTQAFNAWALKTLASHPKGSDPGKFKLTPPPEGYACKLGRFTDHYSEG